jgi:hypothetical protein
MGTLNLSSNSTFVRVPVALSLLLLVLGGMVCAPVRAQDSLDEQPPYFSLLNLVNAEGPVTVKIGSELVGIGQMPYGFYTGPVGWYPAEAVSISADGLEAAEIKPEAKVEKEVRPLYIAYDITEKSAADGSPVKKIKVLKVPAPTSRPETAIDALNFSAPEDLSVKVANGSVSLPRVKRVRLSGRTPFSAQVVPNGTEINFDTPEEGGGLRVLVVFYKDASGNVAYVVTRG